MNAFHFGSHYSNPGVISYYLIRIQPFSRIAYNLQGYNFDFSKNEVEKMDVEGQNELEIHREATIIFNQNNNLEPFNLDSKFERDMKMKILFSKYKKVFLVKYKSLKPPKNLRDREYQQIFKYL